MAKTNEFVGVDDKYIPEEEKKKVHTKESLIGSENEDKLRSGVRSMTSKFAEEKTQKKIKKAAKIGIIGYISLGIIVLLFVIFITVFVTINIFKGRDEMNQERDDQKEVLIERNNEAEKSREEFNQKYDEVEKQYNEMKEQIENSMNSLGE